jgi:hypothetical protein
LRRETDAAAEQHSEAAPHDVAAMRDGAASSFPNTKTWAGTQPKMIEIDVGGKVTMETIISVPHPVR